MASASSDGAGTSTITNALGVGDQLTALATLVAALVNPGATNPTPPVASGPMQVDLKTPGERKDFNDALALLAAKKAKDEADRISLIVAIVRLSAVTAELAVEKVAKKVKNKPTEQRDVSDVESSEETGD
jgi:hypothetical protein